MSASAGNIAAAEAQRDACRQQMLETLAELKELLAPRKIVNDAWESAKIKGADLAEDAVDAVKRRPVATGGVIAALAMLLAREPIKDGLVSIYDAMTSKKPKSSAPAGKASPARKPTTASSKTRQTRKPRATTPRTPRPLKTETKS